MKLGIVVVLLMVLFVYARKDDEEASKCTEKEKFKELNAKGNKLFSVTPKKVLQFSKNGIGSSIIKIETPEHGFKALNVCLDVLYIHQMHFSFTPPAPKNNPFGKIGPPLGLHMFEVNRPFDSWQTVCVDLSEYGFFNYMTISTGFVCSTPQGRIRSLRMKTCTIPT